MLSRKAVTLLEHLTHRNCSDKTREAHTKDFVMYLLNARTRELAYFVGSAIPRYAILSHTWGEEEVTFKDLTEPLTQSVEKKLGYAKIVHTCDQALLEDLEYAWVDTCTPLFHLATV